MTALAHSHLNGYQKLVRKIILQSKVSFLIPTLSLLYGTKAAHAQLRILQNLPAGTLGREVADKLAEHDFQLIPHYENHDLKHVMLGYDMTPEDELRLKAFMLGNGDWSFACLIFLSFAVLAPEMWPELRQHYYRGRQTQSITHWTLAEYATQPTSLLRQQIGLPEPQPALSYAAA
jgi:ubiquinone biosynthesis protein Coq4